MKNCLRIIMLLGLIYPIAFTPALSQVKSSKPVYVIVHGAWGGGWAFRKVDSLLTAAGAKVYRPTLTGQGERVHLASKDVGLNTHILDIVNTILYEDLHDIIVVGHSYGGMVVAGVADSLLGRIKKRIYLDAMVPSDGEGVFSIQGSGTERTRQSVNGFLPPSWVKDGTLPPKDVPHSLKTLRDTIVLKNKLAGKIPTTYILTVEKGKDPKDDSFASQAERVRKKGWPVLQLEADHNAQWSAPEALVKMLTEITNSK